MARSSVHTRVAGRRTERWSGWHASHQRSDRPSPHCVIVPLLVLDGSSLWRLARVARVPDSCQIARLNERTHGHLRRNAMRCGRSRTYDRHAHRQAVLPSWWCGFDSRHPLSRKRPGQDHIPELGFADCGSTSCARFVPAAAARPLLVSTGGSAVRAGADRDNHRLSGRWSAWSHADQPIQGC
jgi:hypothetical protein